MKILRLENCFECEGKNTWCPIFVQGKQVCEYKEDANDDLQRYGQGDYENIMNLEMLQEYLAKQKRGNT